MWDWVRNKREIKIDPVLVEPSSKVYKPCWVVGKMTSLDWEMPTTDEDIEVFVRGGWCDHFKHDFADIADGILREMMKVRQVVFMGARPKSAAGSNFSIMLATAYPEEEIYVKGLIHLCVWIPNEISYNKGRQTLYTKNANGVPNLMVVQAINNLSYQTGMKMSSWMTTPEGSYVLFIQPHGEGFFNLPSFLMLTDEAIKEKY